MEPNVTITRTNVTRAMAETWLTRNINRRAQPDQWAKYRDIILYGHWVEDGNPIRLDADGNLRDGQKRLRGLIAADDEKPGITIPVLVVEGLAPEAQLVMDTGQKRSFANWLEINQIRYPTQAAAIVKLLHAYSAGALVTRAGWTNYIAHAPTHADLWDYYLTLAAANVDIDAAVAEAARTRPLKIIPSVAATGWIITSTISHDDAAYFYAQLSLHKPVNPGEGAQLLIRTLNNQGRLRKYDSQAQLALLFKAWRIFREGRTADMIGWRPGGSAPETFPYPDDDIMFRGLR